MKESPHPLIVRRVSVGPRKDGSGGGGIARGPDAAGATRPERGRAAGTFSASKRAGPRGRSRIASLAWGKPGFPHGPPSLVRWTLGLREAALEQSSASPATRSLFRAVESKHGKP